MVSPRGEVGDSGILEKRATATGKRWALRRVAQQGFAWREMRPASLCAALQAERSSMPPRIPERRQGRCVRRRRSASTRDLTVHVFRRIYINALPLGSTAADLRRLRTDASRPTPRDEPAVEKGRPSEIVPLEHSGSGEMNPAVLVLERDPAFANRSGRGNGVAGCRCRARCRCASPGRTTGCSRASVRS